MYLYEKQTSLLVELGLSGLEARIYLSLLKNSRRTGYQVAKELGEPVANTYKAMESLRKEGLALAEASAKVKAYSALPIGLYLDQRELQFSRKRRVLEDSLKSLVPAPTGEGYYTVENTDQLYTLASSLIAAAKEAIAVDATLLPLEQIQGDLQRAARKGRNVLIKSYTAVKIPGCAVVHSEQMASSLSELPFQLLHLVVPGEGYIIALTDIDNSRLFSGIYVRNLFLSILAYNGFTMEFLVTRAFEMLHRGRSGSEVLKEWNRLLKIAASRTSAWGELIKSLGLSSAETKA